MIRERTENREPSAKEQTTNNKQQKPGTENNLQSAICNQKMPMTKTNAVRALDKAGIDYELRSYNIDEADLSAERAAAKLGMAPETVFKTLITRGDRSGPVLACIPAGTELDLRALGEASGNKRVEMVPLREVLDLTGYMRGAVTPLATKKPFPVFIDETAELWPVVGISGGLRGLEILLAPADLIRMTGARLADIARQT